MTTPAYTVYADHALIATAETADSAISWVHEYDDGRYLFQIYKDTGGNPSQPSSYQEVEIG